MDGTFDVFRRSPESRGPLVATESSAERRALADPDVRLMLEVRQGSATAFEQLVGRYQDRLVRLLQHMVGHRHQAEDLAQDVFLRVYRARENYRPGAKFATWLFTIANNVALNARRGNARRREVSLGGGPANQSGPMSAARPLEGMLQVSSGQLPARQIDKAEMRDIVRMALESLGERQRMAVLLNKFEQLSYAEIGESMEMTETAVKSLLARARGNLRDVLAPYLQEGRLPSGRAEDGSDGARSTASERDGQGESDNRQQCANAAARSARGSDHNPAGELSATEEIPGSQLPRTDSS